MEYVVPGYGCMDFNSPSYFCLKNMMKEASSYLFSATKNRLFIESVKILIPITWKKNNNYLKTRTETYEKVRNPKCFTRCLMDINKKR